jgi:hypothetical protein
MTIRFFELGMTIIFLVETLETRPEIWFQEWGSTTQT